jgi:thymidylate synthase (FAD)
MEHGFVRLVDSLPREELDSSIVQAARVSYSTGTKSSRSDKGLIRYLLRHWHTTPFEMVDFKFHLKMPIFVARQWLRHRTASVNEMSARYSLVPNEFHVPEEYRQQSSTNKQGSEGPLLTSHTFNDQVQKLGDSSFELYDTMIQEGCTRELARCHLPQSTYTEFYWKINLHNLLHFLHLRTDSGAQEEIRWYADKVMDLIKPLVPLTMEAFADYRLNSIQLSGPEIQSMRNGSYTLDSPGENREFQDKLKTLGINQ